MRTLEERVADIEQAIADIGSCVYVSNVNHPSERARITAFCEACAAEARIRRGDFTEPEDG